MLHEPNTESKTRDLRSGDGWIQESIRGEVSPNTIPTIRLSGSRVFKGVKLGEEGEVVVSPGP